MVAQTRSQTIRSTEREHEVRFADGSELNDPKVEQSMNALRQLIIDLVTSITKLTTIDEYSWPELRGMRTQFKELDALFRKAMGLGQEELDKAFRRLRVKLEDAREYLRMLIAAEVWIRVLAVQLPAHKPAKRSCAENGGPESEGKNDQLTPAEIFAVLLLFDIDPMLNSIKSPQSHLTTNVAKMYNIAENIYDVAMKLLMDMSRKRCTYVFFWPGSGGCFDETTMDAEVQHLRLGPSVSEDLKRFQVAVTLMPGVRRIEPPESGRKGHSEDGTVIYKAGVYLGPESAKLLPRN